MTKLSTCWFPALSAFCLLGVLTVSGCAEDVSAPILEVPDDLEGGSPSGAEMFDARTGVEVACSVLAEGAPCDDRDACTVDDVCQSGICVGGANVVCDDGGNGCHISACVDGECVGSPLADGTACGVACLSGVCEAGECAWQPETLSCPGGGCQTCDVSSAQCVPMPAGIPCDDGEPCLAHDTCDAAGQCAGGTPACDDSALCIRLSCKEVNGEADCQQAGYKDFASGCDDNDPCTVDDQCIGGQAQKPSCVGAPKCDDGVECTIDSCSNGGECESKPSELGCDDGNACTVDSCDPIAGCLHSVEGAPSGCDDGNECTSDDACVAGSCMGHSYDCADGKECTVDTCDGMGGCGHAVVETFCMIDGACIAAEQTATSNLCSACQPAISQTGYSPVGDGALCDDGDACTAAECVQGQCVGSWVGCDVEKINNVTLGNQADPVVGVFDDGRIVIAWTSEIEAKKKEVVVRHFQGNLVAPDGFMAEQTVNVATQGDQQRPAIAILKSSAPRYVLAWEHQGTQKDVAFRVFESSGAPTPDFLAGEVTLTGSGTQKNLSAAALDDGGFMLAWQQGGGVQEVRWQTFDEHGNATGEVEEVLSSGSGEKFPVAAALPGGAMGVAFQNNSDVWGQLVDPASQALLLPNGDVISDDVPTSAGKQIPTDIVALTTNRWLVAWEDSAQWGETRGRLYQVGAMPEDGGAMSFGPVGGSFVLGGGEGEQTHAHVAAFSDGSFHTCWADRQPGEVETIRARTFIGGAGGVITQVSDAVMAQKNPRCRALPGAGRRMVVVWECDEEGFGSEICGRVVVPD